VSLFLIRYDVITLYSRLQSWISTQIMADNLASVEFALPLMSVF